MIGICFSHTSKCAPCDACVRDAHLGRQVVVLVEQQGQRCLQHAQAKSHKHLQTRLLRAVQVLALMLLSAEHATVKDNPVSLLAQAGAKRAVGQQPKCHNALAWEPSQLMHAVGQLHSFRGPCVAWLACQEHVAWEQHLDSDHGGDARLHQRGDDLLHVGLPFLGLRRLPMRRPAGQVCVSPTALKGTT